MLRNHKEQIEEIIEIHQSESKPEDSVSRIFTIEDIEGSIDFNARSKTNLALDSLSKETLDYIQTLYYVGTDYKPKETELTKEQSFDKYLNYVKSFGNDKKSQVYYLSMKTHLSEYVKKGIDTMGWDIDQN